MRAPMERTPPAPLRDLAAPVRPTRTAIANLAQPVARQIESSSPSHGLRRWPPTRRQAVAIEVLVSPCCGQPMSLLTPPGPPCTRTRPTRAHLLARRHRHHPTVAQLFRCPGRCAACQLPGSRGWLRRWRRTQCVERGRGRQSGAVPRTARNLIVGVILLRERRRQGSRHGLECRDRRVELLPHRLHLGSGGASAMVTVIGPSWSFRRSPLNHPHPGSPVPA